MVSRASRLRSMNSRDAVAREAEATSARIADLRRHSAAGRHADGLVPLMSPRREAATSLIQVTAAALNSRSKLTRKTFPLLVILLSLQPSTSQLVHGNLASSSNSRPRLCPTHSQTQPSPSWQKRKRRPSTSVSQRPDSCCPS